MIGSVNNDEDKDFDIDDSFGPSQGERRLVAMEVSVDHSIEKAMKILKRKLIKEGLFRELKARRYFEKPCERRKRKNKESAKKIRKDNFKGKAGSLIS